MAKLTKKVQAQMAEQFKLALRAAHKEQGKLGKRLTPELRVQVREQLEEKARQQKEQAGKPRVRIIGSSLGGLALARTLQKHGIPSVVYERRPTHRRGGLSITLHEPAYRPLLEILGMEEPAFRRRVAVDSRVRDRDDPVAGGGRIDPALLLRPVPGVDYATSFRAHRRKLEEVMADGLDIRYNEEVEQVSTGTAPGFLALHMKGFAAPNLAGLNNYYRMRGIPMRIPPPFQLQTPLLVAADGALSIVRTSLAPESEAKTLPYVAYYGWRRLTREKFDEVCAPALKGSTVIEKRLYGGVVLTLAINDVHTNAVDMAFIYSRPVRKWARDPLVKADPPVGGDRQEQHLKAKDIPPEFYQELEALGENTDLEEPFRHIFEAQKVKTDGRCKYFAMRSTLIGFDDLHALAGGGKGGACFLGEAAHAEPVLGGDMSSKAILDGIELGKCIADHGLNLSGVPDWYDSKYEEWERGVKESEKAIQEIHGGLIGK